MDRNVVVDGGAFMNPASAGEPLDLCGFLCHVLSPNWIIKLFCQHFCITC